MENLTHPKVDLKLKAFLPLEVARSSLLEMWEWKPGDNVVAEVRLRNIWALHD